ncbi:MAG: class I SAM-dependent methyltransferase [Verrucomicrobiota bacterium]
MQAFQYQPRATCVCGELLGSSPSIIKKLAQGSITFFQCARCGSWIQSPQITIESLKEWYDSDEYQGSANQAGSIYLNYIRDEPHRVAEAQNKYHRFFAPLIDSHSDILEIGCASASLLSVFKKHGHRVAGIDLSQRFASLAKELYDIDVHIVDLLSAQFTDASFDAILMFGTICNLVNLPASLKKIHNLLKPQGRLIFNYPACNAWISRLYGEHFWMFTPSVSSFLSDQGCTAVLNHHEFQILRRQTDWQQPSFSKLMLHARFKHFLRYVPQKHLPCLIPIPTIRLVAAIKQ